MDSLPTYYVGVKMLGNVDLIGFHRVDYAKMYALYAKMPLLGHKPSH